MKMWLTKLLGIFLFIVGTAVYASGSGHHHHHHDDGDAWQVPESAMKRKNPIPADKPSIERGQKIYGQYCVSCHGDKGRGDGPAAAALDPKPADLVVMAPLHTDGDFAWRIAEGRGAMPAWKNVLTEAQIWDTVNYLKNLK